MQHKRKRIEKQIVTNCCTVYGNVKITMRVINIRKTSSSDISYSSSLMAKGSQH